MFGDGSTARVTDAARTGRPWGLPLEDRALLVAAYRRTNLTMRQVAPLCGVSSASVCQDLQRMRTSSSVLPALRAAGLATARRYPLSTTQAALNTLGRQVLS